MAASLREEEGGEPLTGCLSHHQQSGIGEEGGRFTLKPI